MKYRNIVPRLQDFDYTGPYGYFVTCLTYKRAPYFQDQKNYDLTLPILKEIVVSRAIIYAYCFMPDHLHLLLEGLDNFNLIAFMKLFKQKSSYTFKQKTGFPLWQRGYYDHVLRSEEAYDEVAKYIFNNPVRRGLVRDFRKYKYSGSFAFDKKDFA